VVSNSKANIFGALKESKVNIIRQFSKKSRRTKKKKNNGKQEFLRKTSFRPNQFFYMVVTQKLITLSIFNKCLHWRYLYTVKFLKYFGFF